MSEGFRGGRAGAWGGGAGPRGQRSAGAAPPRPERAGGGGVRDLPRGAEKRGGRPHRLDPPARAPDVQGLAPVRPVRREGRSPASSSASAPTSTPRPGSTGRTTTRPCRRSTWSWPWSSRRTACGTRSCATRTCDRDDRRAQRVRARRELAVPGAAQADVRDRVSASTRTTIRRSGGAATSRTPRSTGCGSSTTPSTTRTTPPWCWWGRSTGPRRWS